MLLSPNVERLNRLGLADLPASFVTEFGWAIEAPKQSDEELIWVVSLLIFHDVTTGSSEFLCQHFYCFAGISVMFFCRRDFSLQRRDKEN